VRVACLLAGALLVSACGPRVGGDAGFRVHWSAVWGVGDDVFFMAQGAPNCESTSPILPFPQDCSEFQQRMDAMGNSSYDPSFTLGARDQITSFDSYESEGALILGGVKYFEGCPQEVETIGMSSVLELSIDGDRAQVRSKDIVDGDFVGSGRFRLDLTTMYCEFEP